MYRLSKNNDCLQRSNQKMTIIKYGAAIILLDLR